MSSLPEEVQARIDELRGLRDQIRHELGIRRITGRPRDKMHADIPTSQLEAEERWYNNKIDELLAPYEK